MDPTMLPYPIESAPRPDQDPVSILLYCPEEGRWYTGVWWAARGGSRAMVSVF